MGLPLYRAPVGSDIKSKAPKDPPTRARSTIRRNRRNINGSDSSHTPAARFHAYRNGRTTSSPGAEETWTPWDSLESAETSGPPLGALRRSAPLVDPYPLLHRSSAPQNDAARPPRQTDSALREVVYRNGVSQDMARYFGEHMAMLHAATSPRPSQPTAGATERQDLEPSPYTESRTWAQLRDGAPSPRQTPRLTSALGTFFSAPQQTHANIRAPDVRQPDRVMTDIVLRRQDGHLITLRRLRGARAAGARAAMSTSSAGETQPQQQQQTPPPPPPPPPPPQQQQPSAFDGLGDRNRSLSPEGDSVWDTLLSSITPDPQPPSVGTSFASTSATPSAAPSQTTANSVQSSHTHVTGPAALDALEDFDFDHACESGGDNTDTDCDEEDNSRENELRRFGRSYADVVARSRSRRDDNDFDLLRDVESMQRIVRTLARREDIPDEWWAEAGLSRSLPREAA